MTYPDGVHQLIRVEEEKDLGVLFSSTLKFSHHIKEIVHKVNRLLGLIKRTFKFLEPQMLRNLYTTLIRPHLDYACVIWNPSLSIGRYKDIGTSTKKCNSSLLAT